MTPLTPEAQRRLDGYLGQVRAALRGCRSVSADEVERDVREHVDRELEGTPGPVPLAALEAVLGRLGSPGQWVPVDELPAWRRVAHRLRNGPEDWRLAYLAFGLLLAGVVAGLLSPVPFTLFLGASFLAARAALAVARARGEDLGAQKWLLYPALLPASLALLAVLFLWPVMPAGALGDYLALWNYSKVWVQVVPNALPPNDWFVAYGILAALGLWWTVLGLLARLRPGWLAALVYPFAGRALRVTLAVAFGTGLVLAVLCSTVLVRVWANAGVLF
jgi:hypothetical protein